MQKEIRLFPKQSQIFQILTNFKTPIRELLIGGGAGGAKTTTGCLWLAFMACEFPRTRRFIGRAEKTALKMSTYNTFLDVAQDQLGLSYGRDFKLSQQNVIKFSNGSEIVLIDLKYYPTKDPNFDKLGSTEFTGGFIDEVNQIIYKAYQVASSRVGRYKNNVYGIPGILLMSCNPAKNWVYKEFYRKQKDGSIEPQKMFIQVIARHNPYIAKDYIEKLRNMED